MDIDLTPLLDRFGETPVIVALGAVTGFVFGVAAQRSRFCLRAATVEFAEGRLGPRMAVWLLCFSTALVWVQGATLSGLFSPQEARFLAVPGSWSGAILGGLVFGAGMILARGCSGRLLVLAATGNLRSIVSGLIFAVTAQMALAGWLAPLRNRIAALWTTEGGTNLDLGQWSGLGTTGALVLGAGLAVVAVTIALRNRIGWATLVFGSGVGFAVALGYVLTARFAASAFDPVSVQSLTFTGPSADMLMLFVGPEPAVTFATGLIAGVFLGALVAAGLARELAWQGFEDTISMRRAMVGAAMMGFGGMLAGGCAIGAGVSGGSVLAGTAWVALTAMWVGAVATHRVLALTSPSALTVPASA